MKQRYQVQFWVGIAVYVTAVIGIALALKANLIPKALLYPVALVPVIPISYALVAQVRLTRCLDELQRTIQLEGLAISSGATGIIALSYGFLQAFANAPNLSWIYVYPLLAFTWAIGMMIARARYT
jgi:hypothetical protein